MRVIGLGNALVDIILPVSEDQVLEQLRLPKGSMQLIDEAWMEEIRKTMSAVRAERASGGSASNTIHGLASLGLETGFIGSVGADELGTFFEQDLRDKGIRPHLRTSPVPTGRAHAFVSRDSERTFGTYLGAALELAPGHLQPDFFSGYDWLYVEGYLVQNHALIEGAMQMARQEGLKVALDLASYNVVEENRAFLEHLLKEYVDLVFANEEESRAMTGKEPAAALLHLAEWCTEAVVKTGPRGSLVLDQGEVQAVEPFPAQALDTSGAGDLYAAGYLYGRSQSLDPVISGRIGSLISSHVIAYYGPKLPLHAWEEVYAGVKRLESYA